MDIETNDFVSETLRNRQARRYLQTVAKQELPGLGDKNSKLVGEVDQDREWTLDSEDWLLADLGDLYDYPEFVFSSATFLRLTHAG